MKCVFKNLFSYNSWILLLFIVLIGISCVFCFLLKQSYARYSIFAKGEIGLRQNVVLAKDKLQEQEMYLQKILTDTDFFERVVRQRLGYAKPNEIVFRFDRKIP